MDEARDFAMVNYPLLATHENLTILKRKIIAKIHHCQPGLSCFVCLVRTLPIA